MKVQAKTTPKYHRGRTTKSRDEHYIKVFTHVLLCYDETKSTSGTMSCAGLYNRMNGETSSASGPFKINESDYLADVELAMKAVLGNEWREQVFDEHFPDSKKRVVGKEFMRRYIYPISEYMKPKGKQ